MTTSVLSLQSKTLAGSPQPFFRMLEIDCARISQPMNVIDDLRRGNLTGIVIRGVYDESFMAAVTDRLEQHDPPFLKTHFPEKFRSWFYGRNLNLMGTDPASYFTQAAEFHQHMQQLFPGKSGIREHMMQVLSALDGDRPYRAAPGPEPQQQYMLTTFRGHAQGGYIPAHCDNEQSVRPAYEHLSTLVSDHMYSAVLMINAAERGGLLEVFDYRVDSQKSDRPTGALAGKVDLAGLSSVQISLRPGDLVVVDSGRYLHQVTPVEGDATRWVACSFMARSLERNAVYCWG